MYKVFEDGRFEIYDYNWKAPFSNFFPGIAGRFGIPMWVYYVSRNQGIISFGVRDKNHQILEFLSFNKAVEFVGVQGFRTFLKIGDLIYEPFKKYKDKNIKQKMTVYPFGLKIEEENDYLKLRFKVFYFNIVKDSFPGIVRVLTIENYSKKAKRIEVVDGLPRVIPYGVDLHGIQVIPRHIEGMMNVVKIKGIPVYRLKQTPQDIEKVGEIEGGNFYFAFSDKENSNYIYDPEVVFKECFNFEFPWGLRDGINLKDQVSTNRTPSAFSYFNFVLNDRINIYEVIGFVEKDRDIDKILKIDEDYIERSIEENKKIIDSIRANALTILEDWRFSNYVESSFLDNVIRGGIPIVFKTRNSKSAFYLYSRQNGDLERDYHFFVLEPTYYSQGTGHYRSVLQNRRCDTWFFPEVEDRNILTFMSLIQFDGYNPLEITPVTYRLRNFRKFRNYFSKFLNKKEIEELERVLSKSFTPGKFLKKIEEMGKFKRKDYENLLRFVISCSDENECGEIHEGFWIDHWFYNLDLIDTYLSIYPEKIDELFFGRREYYFYDNPDIVRPRDEKFVLVDGKVRQYNAVIRSEEKMEMINKRKENPRMARTKNGNGDIYYTNLFVKLLLLLTTRMSSFDPFLTGIEMEADKPGWNDSMNGLPGIIGSSSCEMFELERLINLLLDVVENTKIKRVKIYEELYEFMVKLNKEVKRRINSKEKERNYIYWDRSHKIKEKYRKKVLFGIRGKEIEVGMRKIKEFLKACRKFFDKVIYSENRGRIFNKDGIPYTYFENEVIEYEILKNKNGTEKRNEDGYKLVRPLRFKQKPLPLFLEGSVHFLKVNPHFGKRIYKAVKNSNLFDRKLKMYKVCESLKDAPFEIGRVKAWGPGWIENESVYTHMEYKYILEIIRSGVYDGFYDDIKTVFTCYMNPEVYKRSPFENVSFIVSSAFPDKKMHGQGFQPRLSGVTVEMINIWILMVAGKRPFYLKDGKIYFKLEPVLKGDFFLKRKKIVEFIDVDEKKKKIELERGDFLFKLCGKIIVIYKNKELKDTFGENKAEIRSYTLYYKDGKTVKIEDSEISEPYSTDIRDFKISKIIVEME